MGEFKIICSNCGKEIILKTSFLYWEYEGLEVKETYTRGVLITCECGNEICSQ